MSDKNVWLLQNVVWLAGIALTSAGLACCVTLLNLASRVIMTLGGFVAAGGPYEIAHPAPDWVILIPISIISGFAFGGLSMRYSSRTGGFSLVSLVWSGLFLSLGYQFAVMGINPPQIEGIAWGWIICAITFIPMGLAPLPSLLRGRDMFTNRYWIDETTKPYNDRDYKLAYLFCVTVGAIIGIIIGVLLFRVIAG